MINNFVSIYQIIAKLYRDYEYKAELDVWDVVEWAGEAMDLIGSYPQMRRVPNHVLTVTNYKAKLPCDLETLDGVKYSEIPMVWGSGVYGPTDSTEPNEVSNTILDVEVNDENFPMLGNRSNWTPIPYTYIVQNGYLHTNLEKGEIVISYTGIMVDKDGYPMIPDDAVYKNAISNFVQMMLDRRDWRAQRAPEAHYRDSKREWEKFAMSARGRAQMPSLDKMETIKRMWLRLRPNHKSHNSGFDSFIAPNARGN
jgi:hypothetical protein